LTGPPGPSKQAHTGHLWVMRLHGARGGTLPQLLARELRRILYGLDLQTAAGGRLRQAVSASIQEPIHVDRGIPDALVAAGQFRRLQSSSRRVGVVATFHGAIILLRLIEYLLMSLISIN